MEVAVNGYFLNVHHTGSGQYAYHLLRALQKRNGNHRLTVQVPYFSRDTMRPVGGIRAHAPLAGLLRSGNLAKLWWEQVTWPRQTAKLGDGVVGHVPYFAPPHYHSFPLVATIHDLIPVVLPEYRGNFLVRLYTSLVMAAAHKADAIIADSEAAKREMVEHLKVSEDDVHVVHLAADSRFSPDIPVEDVQAVRRRYDLPERFLFYLGGVDVRKNIGTLFAALTKLPEDVSLVVAGRTRHGKAALFPDWVRQATESDVGHRVRFLGGVPEADKPLLYRAATVFTFPSRYEGFGLDPLEAMACGTPVVCSDTTSLPEVVADGGILVAPEDADAWAAAIGRLWESAQERGHYAERALTRARSFSWERTAAQTIAVYEQVS
ncbi:MAG: glycosyltransferase family 1 protein [Chloroflexi bacterium]|nr:glycosyltransferase family 1 protein [Chloroflexota bacterium]